jgi:ATP-binding cassette subfamily B multidrug efflux pump
MAGIYLAGLIASYVYNVLMSIIGQGVQKRIRDELFDHLETLPISYFDRRGHGDIMSIFTNDVDALREMLSRALPMVAQSIMTIVACLCYDADDGFASHWRRFRVCRPHLLLHEICRETLSRYFIQQQIELGKTNGYIEEMINGQRVVKVFNYEERNIAGFNAHNDAFFTNSVKANRFASILMPTVNQLGNIQYALIALLGGLAITQGVTGYSLTGAHVFQVGIIVSFLLYSKSFTQPIGQVSQQLNVMALALAGATRIFEVIDAPKKLMMAMLNSSMPKPMPMAILWKCKEHTGHWAWKHPHKDGSPTTYVWVKGKITFDMSISPISLAKPSCMTSLCMLSQAKKSPLSDRRAPVKPPSQT